MIPRAQPDGGQRRAAHADKGAESGNHHDDRQGHAHAGQRHIPYAWNVADIDAVYNIIEHIDDLSSHAGQAELKQKLAKRRAPKPGFVCLIHFQFLSEQSNAFIAVCRSPHKENAGGISRGFPRAEALPARCAFQRKLM